MDEGRLNLSDPELLNSKVFGNIAKINRYGFLVTKKNEKNPYFIPAKMINDSILSKVKKGHMKLEFIFLSDKVPPAGSLQKRYKMESRWIVQEALTYRSKVWEVVMVDSMSQEVDFTLSIDFSYLLRKVLKKNMEKELLDPLSGSNAFGANMREHVLNHGIKWYFS